MKFIYLILVFSFSTSSIIFAQNSEQEIRAELSRQQTCWNEGDIECFMLGYWNSEELRFLGRSGLSKGWQKTLENYVKSYPDRTAMGRLEFDVLFT